MSLCSNADLKRYPLLRVFFCLMFLSGSHSFADTINVAVASNFTHTLKTLSADFGSLSGHDLVISSASTGKLYAQLRHGAPYDVFLAADEVRPDLLVSEKRAIASSAYVYAKGLLVLLSNLPAEDCQRLLYTGNIKHLSIANPEIAPYGLAARQVLEKLSLWPAYQGRLVLGENITQAFQFVDTKNAEAGFVARSLLKQQMLNSDKDFEAGCLWHVPVEMYDPIRQKMVVLNRAKDNPAAQAFQQYMRSARAKEIIQSSGYDVTP